MKRAGIRDLKGAAPYLLLAAAVFAAYANVYGNAFVNDDIRLIVQNAFLRDWIRLPDLVIRTIEAGSGREGFFHRPLQMLLYFFTYQLFGLSTPAFHFLNVALHAANAALMHRLGCRLGFRPAACFAAALLWAVHPVHTEAVTYMSATADPLFTLFCLLGLHALLPDFTPRKVWAAGLLFLLALGAKESAVVFPALAGIMFFLASPERLRPSAYLRTWPLWLVAAAYLAAALARHYQGGHLDVVNLAAFDGTLDALQFQSYQDSVYVRILTALATLPAYLKLLLWPSGLHMERVFAVFDSFRSWQVLLGAVMAGAATAQIIWRRGRRGLALSFGLLWFAAAHAPNSGVVFPINALMAEHWMYLPAAGLFLGLAGAFPQRLHGKAALMAVALAAAFLGARTFVQNRAWADDAAYYENILASGEKSRRAYNLLGKIYWARGDFEKAIAYQREAVRRYEVWQRRPILPFMHFNLALMYLGARPQGEGGTVTIEELLRALPLSGRIPEAVAEMGKAHALDPDFYWTNKFLSVIYGHLGDKKKAEFYNRLAKEPIHDR